MAEQDSNSGMPGDGSAQEGQMAMPSIQIAAQYIKDLSFENPSMGINVRQPQIDFSVDLQARRMQENGPFEVIMKLRVTATQEQQILDHIKNGPGFGFGPERGPGPRGMNGGQGTSAAPSSTQ